MQIATVDELSLFFFPQPTWLDNENAAPPKGGLKKSPLHKEGIKLPNFFVEKGQNAFFYL